MSLKKGQCQAIFCYNYENLSGLSISLNGIGK
jgi:hypothetical protein